MCHKSIRTGMRVVAQSGRTYRIVSPLVNSAPGISPHVWKAVDDRDSSKEFVAKQPNHHDEGSQKWSLFQHEVDMQNLFQTSPFIRQMTDFAPATDTRKPIMLLEAFEKSLWSARTRRSLTPEEIKWIMKAILLGIWTIHREGLVYSDLKMENVLLNGFKDESPGDVKAIVARLADCGAITKPSHRDITSIAYRSPEVHFGQPFNSSTDIWSWGMIYCHLLEARADIRKPGLLDSLRSGTMEEKTKAVRDNMAHEFFLHEIPYYSKDERVAKLLPPESETRNELDWWGEKLLQKGVAAQDIEFLAQVLNPDPRERWTAADIAKSGYLEI